LAENCKNFLTAVFIGRKFQKNFLTFSTAKCWIAVLIGRKLQKFSNCGFYWPKIAKIF